VVKTYLQWLQDSEFDPNCPLCKESLAKTDKSTIRLPCFGINVIIIVPVQSYNLDLFHWDCLKAEFEKGGEQLLSLSRAKCPLCRVSILPGGDSPLALQIRSILSKTHWADQLPPLKSSTSEKQSTERDPLKGNLNPPSSQPNGVEMVAIDIGARPGFLESINGKGRRHPDEPKVHAPPRSRKHTVAPELHLSIRERLMSITRVIFNCLTLRNVRMCSLGISPRQTLIILAIVFVTFFVGFRFTIFLLQPVS
jgi:hypothetical protein